MPQEVKLSTFQKEKLESFFRFLDPNSDDLLDKDCLDRHMKRILEFTGWKNDDPKAQHNRELHEAFFEVLFEKAVEEGGRPGYASLDDWFHIWSHMLFGRKGMGSFPVWLRLMPRLLFETIDSNGDSLIEEEELLAFYRGLVRVTDPELEQHVRDAYKEMTDDGRWPLNIDSYEQIFANFLIGKTPHGPGKFVFGCFKHEATHFQLIMPASS